MNITLIKERVSQNSGRPQKMMGVMDSVPKQCFQPLIPLKLQMSVQDFKLKLFWFGMGSQLGPIVIVMLSQQSQDSGLADFGKRKYIHH